MTPTAKDSDDYRPRIVDADLRELLGIIGAVVIEGPRGCGKTETARQVAASEVLLDVDEQARETLRIRPSRVLEGKTPRLIDEWQLVPAVWNHIRRAVDDRRAPGQFILTGSAMPADDATRHSGAGRMIRLRMRPMSLFETGHSAGTISLRRLMGGDMTSTSPPSLDIEALAECIVTGGWPRVLGLRPVAAGRIVRGYLDEISRADLPAVGAVRRDPVRVARLMTALSRNVATYASMSTLVADTQGPDGTLDRETIREYLAALERLMVVEDQPPWAPSVRSRSRLRSSSKRHLVDPSLAAAALRLTPSRLLDDIKFMGFLFESLVIRDLRVYSEVADARVFQYRDNTGLEVDAILETGDGRWAAFEVKLGPAQVDDAAVSLLRLAERVDTDRIGKPAMLGVITGFGYGYMRPDGVAVIPIGSLGP
jgi:uncharacterized protein